MSKKRLFLAIPLSSYFLELFERYQKSASLKNIRWISAQNLHVTLQFFGEVEESAIDELCQKLQKDFSALKPFHLEFDKIMFAPPGKPPRMIWAVFKPNEYFKESILHVTLARFKDPHIAKGVDLKQPTVEKKTLDVSHCHLMESQLTPKGSLYALVQDFPL